MIGKYEVPIRSIINSSLQTLTEKGHDLSDMRPIMVKSNLAGDTAGKAHYGDNLIRVNAYLLEKYGQEFINQIVPHEVAHLVCYYLNNNTRLKRPHGEIWKDIMRQLGLSPDRTHRFETSPVRRFKREKPYRYKCGCREVMFTLTRHRRHMRAGRNNGYRCLKCRTGFTYIGL